MNRDISRSSPFFFIFNEFTFMHYTCDICMQICLLNVNKSIFENIDVMNMNIIGAK